MAVGGGSITAGPAGLLDVALERGWKSEVAHEPHLLVIDPHSKRVRGANDPVRASEKSGLHLGSIEGWQAGVVTPNCRAPATQHRRNPIGSIPCRNIHDRGPSARPDLLGDPLDRRGEVSDPGRVPAEIRTINGPRHDQRLPERQA